MLQKSYRSKVHIGRSGNSAIHGALQSESKGSFGRLPRATRQRRLKTRTAYSASLRTARESPAGKIEQEEVTAEAPTGKADGPPLGKRGREPPPDTGTGSAQPSTEANAAYPARAFSARS